MTQPTDAANATISKKMITYTQTTPTASSMILRLIPEGGANGCGDQHANKEVSPLGSSDHVAEDYAAAHHDHRPYGWVKLHAWGLSLRRRGSP